MAVAPLAKLNLHKGDWRLKKPSSSSSSFSLDNVMENPSKRAVPNHLLESRVYTKLGSNASFAADPGILHFGGFETGRCERRVLKLVNISANASNVHIIPPQSKHFSISYKKADRVAPGLALTVDVQFIADECRYYYDCIRVHSEGEETLLVPLHAFPVMDLLEFPSLVSLSHVALGQSARHVLRLSCHCPVDFEFCIVSSPHQDFHVSPASGVVPGGGLAEVTVTYTPSRYGSAQVRLELLVSAFSSRPRVCVVTGTCSPGLTARTLQPEEQNSPEERPPAGQRPSYGASRKKKLLQSLQQSASQVIESQNLRFPVNLSSPHAVSTVLSQRPGKLRARDLRGGFSDKKVKSRQEKEAHFQEALQQHEAEEAANQLRWQVRLGCDPLSENQRHLIMQDHQSARSQAVSGSPDLRAEYRRASVLAGCCRVLRQVDGVRRTPPPLFDLYENDLWAERSRALSRFQQAGRTVLLRRRADGRLRSLRRLLQRLLSEPEGSVMWESSQEEMAAAPQVLHYHFPPYPTEPGGSMDGHIVPPPQPAAAALRLPLCYLGLKVPQHFRAMAYEAARRHGATPGYQSPNLARPLRSGAEEELLLAGISLTRFAAPGQTDVRTHGETEEKTAGGRPLLRPPETVLRPPETVLGPPDLHPMHVFIPAPGLMAFKRPLTFSDIDLEYHLCPLPKYSPHPEAAGGAARKGPIRGVLTWRRLPAVSLSSALPVPDVRRPRGCDPFSVELLPVSGPPALSSLPAADQDSASPRYQESKVFLTPAMLRAEFTASQSRTPHDDLVSREESPVRVDGDALSDKVQGHVRRMKLLSREARLILDVAGL